MDVLFWRRKEPKDIALAGIWQEFYGEKSAAKTKPRLCARSPLASWFSFAQKAIRGFLAGEF
jgi:hypothetical protein